MSKFKIEQEYIDKIDGVLARGLRQGLGSGSGAGQMCVQQAVCYALGEPSGDEPTCVDLAVRSFGVALNDCAWTTAGARADGMRDLAVAQLGSKGVVDSGQFSKALAEKTIRVLIPKLFREVFPLSQELLKAADRCEKEGTKEAAGDAQSIARSVYIGVSSFAAADARGVYAYSAEAAADARMAHGADNADTAAADAARAARAADVAANANANANAVGDKYLILSTRLAVETLQELKSPGCEWL